MFSIFYLSAIYTKLTRESAEWINGFTLQYYLVVDGIRWGGDFAVWLGSIHWLAYTAQIGVALFQATFWLCIPIPRLRWIYLPAGFFLHASFWIVLSAPFPQWLACYAAFIPWSAILLNRRGTYGIATDSA